MASIHEQSLPLEEADSGRVLKEIFTGAGYWTAKLAPDDLNSLRAMIYSQLLYRLSLESESLSNAMAGRALGEYHTLDVSQVHGKIWPKRSRILTRQQAGMLEALPLYHQLQALLGPFWVTEEEAVGWPEYTWRLVRPLESKDVGDVHADKWFWDMEKRSIPDDKVRLKAWIAVNAEGPANALKMLPHSYKKDYPYQVQIKQNLQKPKFDDLATIEQLVTLPLFSGDMVLFHDNQLHGGSVNQGKQTRFSLEWTMLVDKAWVARCCGE